MKKNTKKKPNVGPLVQAAATAGALCAAAAAALAWIGPPGPGGRTALFLLSGTAALLGGASAYVLFRMNRGLRLLAEGIRELHRGDKDLTRRFPRLGWCVLDGIAVELNRFLENMDGLTSTVVGVAQQAGRRMEAVRTSTDRATVGVQDIAERTRELAQAIEEMAGAIQQVASGAETARALSDESREAAAHGGEVVNRTVDLIQGMATSIREATDSIHRLAEQSDRIRGILDVIRDISAQTNLLALNAAIEAARAGESGRGFAVVADEVRSLAQRTQESTTEIESMIGRLQAGTGEVVERMSAIAADSEEAVSHARQTGEVLERISGCIARTADANAQIATAAEEQATVSEQLRSNADAALQTATRVEQLSADAAETTNAVRFTVAEIDMLMGQFRVSHRVDASDIDSSIVHWHDGFLVGVPAMDEQHRRLFELMNDVYRAFRAEDVDQLDRSLQALVELARRHLRDEEALMEAAGYEELASHRECHRKLLADLDAHVERYRQSGSRDALQELLWFLKSWLVDHIYRVDKRYSETLSAHVRTAA